MERKFARGGKTPWLLAVAVWIAAFGLGSAARAQVTIVYGDWQLEETVSSKPLLANIKKFMEENPGITVTPQPVAQGSRDVLYGTGIRAGKGPDVFVLDQQPVTQYVDQNWIVDLSPYIANEGGAKYLSDFYPAVMRTLAVGGKVYGIPNTVSIFLLFSNMTMLHAAGIADPPKTWGEFRADAIRLTKASTPGGVIDQWGYALPLQLTGFNSRFPPFLFSWGGNLVSPDFKHSAMNSPQTRAAFEFQVDLATKDKVEPPGTVSMDFDQTRQLFAQNKLAFLFEPTSLVPNLQGIKPDIDLKQIRATALPFNPGEEAQSHTTLGYRAWFINANSAHKDEAWKLIKFMADADQVTTYYLGTAGLPARISVNSTLPQILNDPFATESVAEIPRGEVAPQIRQWPQILNFVRLNASAAISGSKTADQAIADANAAIESLLQQAAP